MAFNLIADFFSIISPSLFYNASVILVISFIFWELPRSVKLISEEYTSGLYPDTGRVIDFGLLFIGLAAIAYLVLFNATDRVVTFLKTPGITSLFLIIMITVPLLILLGFLKRFFGRFDSHNSVTVFLVHGFLDFMHTLFFISLVVLAVPVVGSLLMGR
ncbi:MAG: hypothetical protein PHV13_00695 [Candidatus ainarchaeum sp.]|nr:hypothetical protein [Candidatus ainarchaeum sp.]